MRMYISGLDACQCYLLGCGSIWQLRWLQREARVVRVLLLQTRGTRTRQCLNACSLNLCAFVLFSFASCLVLRWTVPRIRVN